MSEEIIPFGKFPEIPDRRKVLLETAKQINKDAGENWIDLEDEVSFQDPQSIFDLVRPHIDTLCDCDIPGLVRLFYRVDLPERKVQEVIEEEDPGKVVDHLTFLLVRREALKVFYRLSYSC